MIINFGNRNIFKPCLILCLENRKHVAEEDTFLGQGLPPAGARGARHSAIAGIHTPNVRHRICVHFWPSVMSHFNHLLLNADFFFFFNWKDLGLIFLFLLL